MADLKTNYQDDVLDTSVNERRKYNMITNDDGTISLEDATVYSQEGDSFSAQDINNTNKRINEGFGGFSFYPKLLTQAEYDALSTDIKNTPMMIFNVI